MHRTPPLCQVSALPSSEILPAAIVARLVSRLTIVLVILLAVASFSLSFDALSQLAAESGAVPAARAWVFALLIDGAIVIFSISALRNTISGECVRWPMSLVITTTLASIVLNMAHTRGGAVAWLVAAMPPLLLFLSFESLMKQLAGNLRPAGAAKKRRKVKTTSAAFLPSMGNPSATIAERMKRHNHARALLRTGKPKRAVAREAGVALSTVRRLAGNLHIQAATG